MKSLGSYLLSKLTKVNNAIKGISLFWKWGGVHFKIEILILIITIFASFKLNFTTERLVILLILAVILIIVELINSAFEKTIDYISNMQYDLRARDIKDFMAGLVLTTFILHISVFIIFIVWR
jgi:diacylglycerol kinase